MDIQRLVTLALFILASFPVASWAAAPSEYSQEELRQYINCSINFTDKYSFNKESASDIADAALSECREYLDIFAASSKRKLLSKVSDDGKKHAEETIDGAINKIRENMRKDLIARVIKSRNRPAKE